MKRIIMNRFALASNELKISDVPNPKEVFLPIKGFDNSKAMQRLKAKEGTRVITGEQIIPGVLSTVTGTIKGIEPMLTINGDVTFVRIELSEQEEVDPAIKQEPDFLEKDPIDILEKLNRANLDFCEGFGDTVIVSAVDTDPLQWVSQQVLRENKEVVSQGLKLVKHLTSAKQVVLVVPEPLYDFVSDLAGNGVDIYRVKPVYPNGLPELLINDLAEIYNLHNHLFLRVEKLAASVKALHQGQPFVHKVVSVVDKNGPANFRVRIGTPLKDLLKLKDSDLKDDDKVIIGGPMRGYTCFDTRIPITDDVDSIYVQHFDLGEVVQNKNHQCMSCGKCVRVCPVHLDVNLICRYSEFSIFEKCHEMGVMVCIECGLCAYYCPSDRSLVQFIRLAKKQKMENM